MIVKELIAQAEQIDIEAYEKTIEDTIQSRGLDSSYAEHADVERQLETIVREVLDLFETPYFPSLLADLIQFQHEHYTELLSQNFSAEIQADETPFFKCITLMV